MSKNPEIAWIKADPIARVFEEHSERTPWRKGDFPTTVSRDGKFIYLASMDTAAPLNDPECLLRLLNSAYDRLKQEIQRFNWSCRRAALIETDYLALWEILHDADALPENYRFPEYHLEMAWRERRPVIFHTRDMAPTTV